MRTMNTALSLVVALGAYCPFVKLHSEEFLATEKAKAKRRKRPLIGRGNYGKSIMAHFDAKRFKAAQEKKRQQEG